MKVCVLGLGYVGLTLALTLADCGVDVFGVDKNKQTVTALKNGKATITENNVEYLLRKYLKKKFHVAENIPKKNFDVFIIAVGTPINDENSPILDDVVSATEEVGSNLQRQQLVSLRSTIPVGLTRKILIPILEKKSGLKVSEDFDIVYAPERTAEGVALAELKQNPQIIGSLSEKGFDKAKKLFSLMTDTILQASSLEAAEMIKLIDNTYRDVQFAYANEIAIICEKLKINARECIEKANFRYPRNRIPVPSPGVGGPCLSKDPRILAYVAKQTGYKPNLIINSRILNEFVPIYLASKVIRKLRSLDKPREKIKIFIIGFAFKGDPETGDLRDSSTLLLLKELKKEFHKIYGYDPVIPNKEIEKVGVVGTTINEGFEDADCVIIMNNHKSYRTYDLENLIKHASKPCIFVDCWGIFEHKKREDGIIYTGIGID